MIHRKSKHKGTVKNGKFIPENRDNFISAFSELEGKTVDVIIQRHKKVRSNNQNKYYWAVVVKAIMFCGGYAVQEEAHDAARFALLTRIGKNKRIHLVSTTSLTTLEFENYLARLRQLISEGYFGDSMYVPLPNESDFDYNVNEIIAKELKL